MSTSHRWRLFLWQGLALVYIHIRSVINKIKIKSLKQSSETYIVFAQFLFCYLDFTTFALKRPIVLSIIKAFVLLVFFVVLRLFDLQSNDLLYYYMYYYSQQSFFLNFLNTERDNEMVTSMYIYYF